MAVDADALETYDTRTLREDLTDAENMISPDETPFISMIAGSLDSSPSGLREHHEWPVVELAAVDTANAVAEGEDDPDVDEPTLALRQANYTQIMDKVVKVSDTSQKVNGAANVERLAKQISYKLRELKRDKETMFLSNQVGVPGAAVGATVRKCAGLATFIQTNFIQGDSNTDAVPGVFSGPGDNGFPDTAYIPSVLGDNLNNMTETMFNDAIQAAWTEGGEPRYAIVSPGNKRLISETFTGFATKFKDGDDTKLTNTIGVYESDFGVVSIVPDRFTLFPVVYILDPEYVGVGDLQGTRQLPLARTGHTDNRLIQWEGTMEVGNQKAHAMIVDVLGA